MTDVDQRSTDRSSEPSRQGGWLVLIGVVLVAFNLRPAAVSVGPVLDEVVTGLGMHPAEAALLTTLPVLSFATVGAIAPRIAHRLGIHRTTCVALLLISLGLATRTRVDDAAAFLVLSFVALAGMAVANVLMPSLVKLHFADRVGAMTAIYTTCLALGLTTASIFTVPFAEMASDQIDWRRGLVVWSAAAVVALLPWFALIRRDAQLPKAAAVIPARDVARTTLGRGMALFFGLQALQAYSIFGWLAEVYRDAGSSPHAAGIYLGVMTGLGIPFSLLVPAWTVRTTDQRRVLSALMACYPVGYLGLILIPDVAPWLWAAVLGIGSCTFPFILTLIGLRATTPAGTAALSGFTQATGYLIAAIGPFGVGVLREASGGWAVPLTMLLALCVPQYLAGLRVCRTSPLEDQLAALTTAARGRSPRTDDPSGS